MGGGGGGAVLLCLLSSLHLFPMQSIACDLYVSYFFLLFNLLHPHSFILIQACRCAHLYVRTYTGRMYIDAFDACAHLCVCVCVCVCVCWSYVRVCLCASAGARPGVGAGAGAGAGAMVVVVAVVVCVSVCLCMCLSVCVSLSVCVHACVVVGPLVPLMLCACIGGGGYINQVGSGLLGFCTLCEGTVYTNQVGLVLWPGSSDYPDHPSALVSTQWVLQ